VTAGTANPATMPIIRMTISSSTSEKALREVFNFMGSMWFRANRDDAKNPGVVEHSFAFGL
jgi:hypothetical protein